MHFMVTDIGVEAVQERTSPPLASRSAMSASDEAARADATHRAPLTLESLAEEVERLRWLSERLAKRVSYLEGAETL